MSANDLLILIHRIAAQTFATGRVVTLPNLGLVCALVTCTAANTPKSTTVAGKPSLFAEVGTVCMVATTRQIYCASGSATFRFARNDFVAVGDSGSPICGLTSQGDVLCTDETPKSSRTQPNETLAVIEDINLLKVDGLPLVDDLQCDGSACCALAKGDASVWCFTRWCPDASDCTVVRVPDVPPAVQVGFKGSRACLLDKAGQIWCWYVGFGGVPKPASPIFNVHQMTLFGLTDLVLPLDNLTTCMVKNSILTCKSIDNYPNPSTHDPAPIELPKGWKHIAIGANAGVVCVLLDSGVVTCRGENDYQQLGQLGKDKSFVSNDFMTVTDVDAVALTANVIGFCALLRDGTVRCWGQIPVPLQGAFGKKSPDGRFTDWKP